MKTIMTQFDLKRRSEPDSEKWEGLAELDRALAENPLPNTDSRRFGPIRSIALR